MTTPTPPRPSARDRLRLADPALLPPSPRTHAGVQHRAIEEEVAAKRQEKERLVAQLAELKGQAVGGPAWQRGCHWGRVFPRTARQHPPRCPPPPSLQSKLPSLRARKAELEEELATQRSRLREAEAYCSDMSVKMEEKKRELGARGELP